MAHAGNSKDKRAKRDAVSSPSVEEGENMVELSTGTTGQQPQQLHEEDEYYFMSPDRRRMGTQLNGTDHVQNDEDEEDDTRHTVARGSASASGGVSGRGFVFGVVVCAVSGLTSPMINFSLAFGKPIEEYLRESWQVPPEYSSLGLWALTVGTTGFVGE